MKATFSVWWVCILAAGSTEARTGVPGAAGTLLPNPPAGITLWWALSSATKIRPEQSAPTEKGPAILLHCARNEREAAQLVLRPTRPLEDFRIECGNLTGPNGAELASSHIEILQVRYLDITQPTDRTSKKGLWPDPLLPTSGRLNLQPDFNHALKCIPAYSQLPEILESRKGVWAWEF